MGARDKERVRAMGHRVSTVRLYLSSKLTSKVDSRGCRGKDIRGNCPWTSRNAIAPQQPK